MRGPSSSSTYTIAYGASAWYAGVGARCTTVYVYTRPRPLTGVHVAAGEPQYGHSSVGTKRSRPQAVHSCTTSSCRRSASQNGASSGPMSGRNPSYAISALPSTAA